MGWLSNYRQGFSHFREAAQNLPGGDPITYASGSSARLNKNIFKWLDKNRSKTYLTGERPLFLYVHSVDPHEEYKPAEEYRERFAGPDGWEEWKEQRDLLLNRSKRRGGNADLYRTTDHFAEVDLDPEPFMEYAWKLYEADLNFNNDSIEELFFRLQDEGLLDDAVIVITADHGDEFMSHGATSHGYSLYNELLHVPFILWGPGIVPEGVRVEQPVQSIDIYPTLVELLGLDKPDGLQGTSLVPLLRGGDIGDHPVFSEKRENPGRGAFLIQGGTAVSLVRFPWKYVHNFRNPKERELPERELFNLEDDPGELENRVDEQPELAKKFDAEIQAWLLTNMRGEVPDATDIEDIDAKNLELLKKLGYIK